MEEGKRGKAASRSATISVRLEPKLRYLAELGARKQRRSLSSFVEWAVQQSLELVEIAPKKTVAQLSGFLWDVDEADRFVKLALNYSELLTHDEHVLWKLIDEDDYFWVLSLPALGPSLMDYTESILGEPIRPTRSHPDLKKIRQHWPQLVAVAQGKASPESLRKR